MPQRGPGSAVPLVPPHGGLRVGLVSGLEAGLLLEQRRLPVDDLLAHTVEIPDRDRVPGLDVRPQPVDHRLDPIGFERRGPEGIHHLPGVDGAGRPGPAHQVGVVGFRCRPLCRPGIGQTDERVVVRPPILFQPLLLESPAHHRFVVLANGFPDFTDVLATGASPGQPEGQARLGIGGIGHLLAEMVGAQTAGHLMHVVGGDGEVAGCRPALVLRLTELIGPGGLSSRALGHGAEVPFGLLASLALLGAQLRELDALAVGLAGVAGLHLDLDVLQPVDQHRQLLLGRMVAPGGLVERRSGLTLGPGHRVAS